MAFQILLDPAQLLFMLGALLPQFLALPLRLRHLPVQGIDENLWRIFAERSAQRADELVCSLSKVGVFSNRIQRHSFQGGEPDLQHGVTCENIQQQLR